MFHSSGDTALHDTVCSTASQQYADRLKTLRSFHVVDTAHEGEDEINDVTRATTSVCESQMAVMMCAGSLDDATPPCFVPECLPTTQTADKTWYIFRTGPGCGTRSVTSGSCGAHSGAHFCLHDVPERPAFCAVLSLFCKCLIDSVGTPLQCRPRWPHDRTKPAGHIRNVGHPGRGGGSCAPRCLLLCSCSPSLVVSKPTTSPDAPPRSPAGVHPRTQPKRRRYRRG